MAKKAERTTAGLRDVLFEEIEELRSDKGNPTKALAVANLAQRIINVTRLEMDYHKQVAQAAEAAPAASAIRPSLGSLQLGVPSVASVETDATER